MKRPFRALFVCLAAVLCPVLILAALLGTAPGLALSVLVVNFLASTPNTKIEISELSGVLLGTPSAGRLSIADANGVWLTASDIEVDLSRWALLAGRIRASRVSAGAIDMARRPEAGTRDETAGTGFRLPGFNARLDNIFVRSIHLSEPVIGEEATLQLTGSLMLRDRPVDLSGALEVVRIDGKSGELSSQWTVAPDANTLELRLSLREPRDGLLARAIDIHGLPAVDANLSGTGALDDWQADLTVSLDNEKTVDGSVSLSFEDDRQTVEGKLEGRLAPLMPQRLAPLFAGKTDIDLSVERDGQNTLRIHRFTAQSALLSLNVAGHVLPQSDTVDLSADLTFGAPDTDVAFERSTGDPIRVGYTRLKTALTGSLEKADWTLAGSIRSFTDGRRSFTDATLSGHSADIDFQAGSGPLAMTLELASASTGQDELDALIGGAITVDITGDIGNGVLTLETSRLSTPHLNADVSGTVDPAERAFNLRVTAAVEKQERGPWNELLGAEAARLSGRIERGKDAVLRFSDITVDSGNLKASGAGSVAPEALQFEGDIELASLQTLNDGLAGSLEATIAVSGTPERPQITVRASGKTVTIMDRPLDALSFEADGLVGSAGPMADIRLNGRYEGQPISLTAHVETGAEGRPIVESLDVAVPGGRASGRLQPNASGILVGTMAVDITSLTDLGPLLLRDDLSGALTGRVVFSERRSRQAIDASLSAATLGLGGVELTDTRFSANLADAAAIGATIDSATVKVGGTEIRSVKADISGSSQKLTFSVDGTRQDAPLSVGGTVTSGQGATAIVLTRAQGRVASIPLELTQPATITLVDGGTRLETLTLSAGQGRITISGSAGQQLAFDVTIDGFPLSLLEAVGPGALGQTGALNATANISGTAAYPTISYRMNVENFSVEASRAAQIPLISIEASGSFASNVLKATAETSGGGMDLKADGSVDFSNVPALDVTVSGTAPFEFAAIPLSSAGILLEGNMDLSLAVGGTSRTPQITGTLRTENATFIEETSALTIRDIVGEIDFNGTRADIARLDGRMGTQGSISVTGSVDLDPASGLPADLKLVVADGTYTNGDIITAQFDADMSVSGPLAGAATIGGTVDLRRTDITIPEQLPSSIPMVDVKHLHASEAIVEQAKEIAPSTPNGTAETSGGLQLDLAVDAPSRIFLRGRGIDAEFGGSLQVFGAVSAPRARGAFNMIRGRLDLLTQRFNFDRGSITFAGPLDPALDFQTTTTVSGASYSILVGGTASSPDISFTSSPSMPEDEILANLFFGRSLARLSPLQIAQLANAVSQLSGVNSGGGGLLSRLRGAGGLTSVDLIPEEDGKGTAIGIGSYLNDRTYVNVEKGLSGASGKVTIDMDLTDNLKARGEIGSDGETKAGVFFERDY